MLELILVNSSRHRLHTEQLVRLEGAGLSVLVFGHVENHHMGMQVRRGIAIHRTGRIMLEGGGNPLAGRLGGMVPADPRLHKLLGRTERHFDGVTMRLANPIILSDQGS